MAFARELDPVLHTRAERGKTAGERKYDAERVLGSFASRLRDELDLEALSEELRAAVSQTVQPARLGVWIRRTGGDS